jgi:hypothetical protein
MEMGTGKSKVLVDNMAMLYDKGKINGALIIAPKCVYNNCKGNCEQPFNASCYRQLSTDSEINNHKINSSFVNPEIL